ncbi:hypothetical protein I4F81_011324 [Pyropia yezoensis]|nr:hypothetical protein I4F81_011324 [Neopyropia yezoensis]
MVQRVVSGSKDGTLRVWDAEGMECVSTLTGHTDGVACMCVVEVSDGASDGAADRTVQRLVSGSNDETLRVWDLERAECIYVLQGHRSRVKCVCVVKVANMTAGGGGGGTVQRVVSASLNCTLRVWDVEHEACLANLDCESGSAYALCAVHCGGGDDHGGGGLTVQRVVCGLSSGNLQVWDVEREKCVAELPGHTSPVSCMSVLAATDREGDVGGSGVVRRVVSGSFDRTLRVWGVDLRECVAKPRARAGSLHSTSVMVVPVDVGGGAMGGTVRRLVSGSRRSPGVWDVEGGNCVAVLKGHTDWARPACVVEVAFAADGVRGRGLVQRVVSVSGDGTLRVWDVEREECIAVLRGHATSVRGACAVGVADGVVGVGGGGTVQRVVSWSGMELRVWDVERQECVAVLGGHTAHVTCVRVVEVSVEAGDGATVRTVQRVVSGSDDKTLRIWEIESGTCVAVLRGHTSRVCNMCAVDVAAAADGGVGKRTGHFVVSWSDREDATVRMWDIERGDCVTVLKDFPRSVLCMCVVAVADGSGGRGGGEVVQRLVAGLMNRTL